MDRPNKNVARGEATRAQLIAIGTSLFASRGYDDTSIEAVLREAGISPGSLYHHFPGQEALFEAAPAGGRGRGGRWTIAAPPGAARPPPPPPPRHPALIP